MISNENPSVESVHSAVDQRNSAKFSETISPAAGHARLTSQDDSTVVIHKTGQFPSITSSNDNNDNESDSKLNHHQRNNSCPKALDCNLVNKNEIKLNIQETSPRSINSDNISPLSPSPIHNKFPSPNRPAIVSSSGSGLSVQIRKTQHSINPNKFNTGVDTDKQYDHKHYHSQNSPASVKTPVTIIPQQPNANINLALSEQKLNLDLHSENKENSSTSNESQELNIVDDQGDSLNDIELVQSIMNDIHHNNHDSDDEDPNRRVKFHDVFHKQFYVKAEPPRDVDRFVLSDLIIIDPSAPVIQKENSEENRSNSANLTPVSRSNNNAEISSTNTSNNNNSAIRHNKSILRRKQHIEKTKRLLNNIQRRSVYDNQYLAKLQSGALFLKYDSTGRPAERWFTVTNNHCDISWNTPNKSQLQLVAKQRSEYHSYRNALLINSEICRGKAFGESITKLQASGLTLTEQQEAKQNEEHEMKRREKRIKKMARSHTSLFSFRIGNWKINPIRTRSIMDIIGLHYGPFHSAHRFRRFLSYEDGSLGYSWLCMTIEFVDRSLDLVAETEEQITAWFLGLQSLAPLTMVYISRGELLWQRLIMKLNYYGLDGVEDQQTRRKRLKANYEYDDDMKIINNSNNNSSNEKTK